MSDAAPTWEQIAQKYRFERDFLRDYMIAEAANLRMTDQNPRDIGNRLLEAAHNVTQAHHGEVIPDALAESLANVVDSQFELIERQRLEIARLRKMAYLIIPKPRWLQRLEGRMR